MIFVVGLNHRTASVEVREQLHFSKEASLLLMELMCQDDHFNECVVLSTCNRTEIYGVTSNLDDAVTGLLRYIETEFHLVPGTLDGCMYLYTEAEAINHLMRVACGLDSMVLGEAQILGQVTEAGKLANIIRKSGTTLHRLFEFAAHAGKRAQTETAIGDHTTSISHAAVILAERHINNPAESRAVIMGAGKMATLAVDALRSHGFERIDVVNRTPSHAQALAERGGGVAYGWDSLHTALAKADVVISATSAPHTVLHRPDIERVMAERNGKPQVLLDTAVPRDICEEVARVPCIYSYNIDDFKEAVDRNHALRQAAVPHVEAIICEETEKFYAWLRGREVVPAIKDLRQKVQEIARCEMEEALRQLPESDHTTVTRLVHRIVNKLLHEPTVRLRAQAANDHADNYVYAIRDLFALDGEEHHG